MATMARHLLSNPLAHSVFAGLVVAATLGALTGQSLLAACAAAAAGIVVCSPSFRQRHKAAPWPALRGAFFVILVLLVATAVWIGPWFMSYWLYSLPLLAYTVLPRRGALAACVVIVAIAAVLVYQTSGAAQRHQLMAAFFLTLVLSVILVFMQEYKRRQLMPLRRTDELTNAASQHYLTADLNKEIQRSEREGTSLSVIVLALDNTASQAPATVDVRSILPQIGRYLHSHIRDFDTCYRIADLQFLIILPGVASPQATQQAESMQQGLQKLLTGNKLPLLVSTGIAGLNIGDDAASLQHSASGALRRAQQRGGSASQTYSGWSPRHPQREPQR